MTKRFLLVLASAATTAAIVNNVSAHPAHHVARAHGEGQSKFTFTDSSGRQNAVEVVDHLQSKKLAQGARKSGDAVDAHLKKAATIAEERANAHSRRKCWAYVKDALLASGAVSSRPGTEFAKQAGDELVDNYGFKKLPLRDPYKAPVGAVLVYTAKGAPGHVEIRTQDGFVSDFKSKTPSPRPLVGIYAKS